MKIIHKELNKGIVKVEVENPDDFWYLDQIIEPEDKIKGRTIRKIKIGDESNPKIVKKPVFLTITVDKVEFHETTGHLRISGKIIDGPDDMPRGNYHTFTITEGTVISILKNKWMKHHLDKIKEAQLKPSEYLVVLFNREEAIFAELKRRRYNILSGINADVQKKDAPETKSDNIYKAIVKNLQEYVKRNDYKNIIAASAGFWKQYLEKELTEELKAKTVYAIVSGVNPLALNELVKRPELKKLLSDERGSQELNLVDEILKAISHDTACYGLDDCNSCVEQGNIKLLAVSNNLIIQTRQNDKFRYLDKIMKTADSVQADIHIVSHKDAMKQLDSLGGVAGVKRW